MERYIYIHIHKYLCIYFIRIHEKDVSASEMLFCFFCDQLALVFPLPVGLSTILPLPMFYGVNPTVAIVLQQCGQCRRTGRMNGRLIHAQTTRGKTISCKGQVTGPSPLLFSLPPRRAEMTAAPAQSRCRSPRSPRTETSGAPALKRRRPVGTRRRGPTACCGYRNE